MNTYTYDDGINEFNCEWLACGISDREDSILINDIDNDEKGWCSSYLVNLDD